MRINISYIILSIFIISIISSCKTKQNLPDPLEAGWKGQKVCELLFENDDLRVLRCSFDPGVGHEKHYHDAHFGYTLEGSTFRIKDSKGTREVDVPGNLHFYNEGIDWHEVLNVGESKGVFLIIEAK